MQEFEISNGHKFRSYFFLKYNFRNSDGVFWRNLPKGDLKLQKEIKKMKKYPKKMKRKKTNRNK